MTEIEASFDLGPYDGTTRAVANPAPKYVWLEDCDPEFIRLRRYELQKDGNYLYSFQTFGARSLFARTYPGGYTIEQLIEKNSK